MSLHDSVDAPRRYPAPAKPCLLVILNASRLFKYRLQDTHSTEKNVQLVQSKMNYTSPVVIVTSPAQANKKEPTTRRIPRRSPIQVLTPPDRA